MDVVSDLTSAPIVGKMYWVPAVFMSRFSGRALWWPIHGHLHSDEDFFDFKPDHYHADQRFLSRRHLQQHRAARYSDPLLASFATPVSGAYAHLTFDYPGKELVPRAPELRRMKCQRDFPQYPYADEAAVQSLNHAFSGRTANHGRLGHVCPHRQYPLGQVSADADGVITCPLHGLRVRAIDGVCVGNLECSKKEPA